MRTYLSIVLALALSACDGTEPERTPRIEPETAEPAHSETREVETPVEAPAEEAPADDTPTPVAEAPDAPPAEAERELAIPESPPLPEPPSGANRAHVFTIPPQEEGDYAEFGDEDELTESDIEEYDRLFIPEAALRPSEETTIPVTTIEDWELEIAIQYPRFRYPDARLTRLVNERVASYARSLASTAPRDGVDCQGIATAELVSVQCAKYEQSSRSPGDRGATGYGALTMRIEGGELRPMSIAEAFLPGTNIPELLGQRCVQQAREEAEENGEDPDDAVEYVDCRAHAGLVGRAAFARRGIVVGADNTGQEWAVPDAFLVTYDEIAEHLVAAGPLARALYRRRARTREVDAAGTRPAAAPTRSVWAIGAMSSTAEAAMAWSRLPAPQRDAVQYVDGYLVAPSQEAARALGSVREVRVAAAARPAAFRVLALTRDAPLRSIARRNGPFARTLPRGTIVVGAEASGDQTRVLATADADGWIETRALGPADACSPDLAPVLASLPESARAGAPATTLRILTRQAGGLRAVFATELGDTIHVELHRMTDACATERALARFDRPGAELAFFGITHTERAAGRALIVTAAGDRLAVHAYDDGRSVFSAPLAEGQRVAVGRSEGDAFFPIVVLDASGERAGAFVWSGETLTAAP